MADIPGLNADVFFGDPEKPLPNWREFSEESDEENFTEEDKESLRIMLGFSPSDLWEVTNKPAVPFVKPSPFKE